MFIFIVVVEVIQWEKNWLLLLLLLLLPLLLFGEAIQKRNIKYEESPALLWPSWIAAGVVMLMIMEVMLVIRRITLHLERGTDIFLYPINITGEHYVCFISFLFSTQNRIVVYHIIISFFSLYASWLAYRLHMQILTYMQSMLSIHSTYSCVFKRIYISTILFSCWIKFRIIIIAGIQLFYRVQVIFLFPFYLPSFCYTRYRKCEGVEVRTRTFHLNGK